MYEVAAIRYGTRQTRKSECYLDWDQYGEPDAEIAMDYFFWVLRNGGRSIVVDTGFHPDVGERRGRTCLCPPVDALRRIGVEPGSVETVILTHLHYDHTGNVDAGISSQSRVVPSRTAVRGVRSSCEIWAIKSAFISSSFAKRKAIQLKAWESSPISLGV